VFTVYSDSEAHYSKHQHSAIQNKGNIPFNLKLVRLQREVAWEVYGFLSTWIPGLWIWRLSVYQPNWPQVLSVLKDMIKT